MRACPYLDIAEMDVSSRIFSCVAYARATNRMIRENGSCMRIHSCISSLETSFFQCYSCAKTFCNGRDGWWSSTQIAHKNLKKHFPKKYHESVELLRYNTHCPTVPRFQTRIILFFTNICSCLHLAFNGPWTKCSKGQYFFHLFFTMCQPQQSHSRCG